ncbi:hypothetical protein [Mesobacterium pallidum]|uniref:hypothetical protein n=1 Tax=Mesobacterium pallidum TaxID=2872037 RepID=UPI001EE17DAA|nr:hypothetical protein [Mesobacterium pallidum]
MADDFDLDALRKRMTDALNERGISYRAASLAAGLPAGYVHSMLTSDHEPQLGRLARVCSQNGISLPYVLFGVDLSPKMRELFEMVEKDPSILPAMMTLLQRTPNAEDS